MPRANRLLSLPKTKAEFIEPMECALLSTLPEGEKWTYEVKLDGYRAIGMNGKNFNKRFPQTNNSSGQSPFD